MPGPTDRYRIGLVVNAGPSMGYGHAVRCRRIARAFNGDVAIYPVSEPCRRYFETEGLGPAIQDWRTGSFPSVMITDLREPHVIAESIREQGSMYISIHDMGLAQCQSDVVIDGSVANVVPYLPDPRRALFLGPAYMITRKPVARVSAEDLENAVLVTVGGGASAEFACRIANHLQPLGLRVVTTAGFGVKGRTSPTTEAEIEGAMARCRFAISTAGTTLYDLLASGVPTLAVGVDRFQLRTADRFQELGAALSAGLLERLSPGELLDSCRELLGNSGLVSRMVSAGRELVDGNGLTRFIDIVGNPGREIWKTHHTQTSTVC